MDKAKLLGGGARRVHTGGSLIRDRPEYIRGALDVVAVALHATFIGLACRNGSETLSTHTDVLLLVVMSAITILFHCIYFLGIITLSGDVREKSEFGTNDYPDIFTFGLSQRNTLKWFEYSITATLGTLSLAYTSSGHNEASGPVLFFLAAVAVTEQTTGYLWDSIDSFKKEDSKNLRWPAYRSYFTTFLCQAAEFVVLANIVHTHETPDDPTSQLVLPGSWYAYTITWSLFGLWAGARVAWPLKLDTLEGNGVQVSEIGYSILSTTAKISLFGTILHEKGIIG